jgi:hypothetical protein
MPHAVPFLIPLSLAQKKIFSQKLRVPQGLKFLSHRPLWAFAEERIIANCEAGLQRTVG